MKCTPRRSAIFISLILAFIARVGMGADLEHAVDFNIDAQRLSTALLEFSKQARIQVLTATDIVVDVQAPQVRGRMAPSDAMTRLLRGSKLRFHAVGPNAIAIEQERLGAERVPFETRVALSMQRSEGEEPKVPADKPEEAGSKGIPEILVKGRRSLNMDIQRTRDDAQPYVTFDHTVLTQSGASNLGEFLKQRLTMNVAGQTSQQGTIGLRGLSSINLRGLGTNQTLILVDGRRVSSPVTQGSPLQADINVYPLGAIERVEILPTTSSGIYGGSATGGVVNIILRRDYSGVETGFTYDNTFDTDSAIRRIDLTAGHSFEGGRTTVLFFGSHSQANSIMQGDRDLYSRGIATVLQNNPTFFYSGVTPVYGATPNIRSSTGANLTLKAGGALGSPFTFVPYGYRGIATDGGAALVANAGRYNFDLSSTSQFGTGRDWSIHNGNKVSSFGATVRREFSSRVNAYIDTMVSKSREYNQGGSGASFTLAASAANNPFNQAIAVRAPLSAANHLGWYYNQNWRVTTGATVKLPGDWMMGVDYTLSKARLSQDQPNVMGLTAAAAASITGGSVDVLRDPTVVPYTFDVEPSQIWDHPFNSTMQNAVVRASGPVFSLPGGAVTLSGSFEHRFDEFPQGTFINGGRLVTYPRRSQSISSGYLETYFPIFGSANRRPLLHELGIQIALRRDESTVRGNNILSTITTPLVTATNETGSTNPTVALKYAMTESVLLRASYGTGFLPPAVQQLAPSVQSFANTTLIDPRRGNEIFPSYDFISSGNPNLQPEDSESFSLGLVLKSLGIQGLRFSADYTRIQKENNITSLGGQLVINNEALFPERVIRAPVAPGDPYGVGRIIAIDASAMNLSSAHLEAYDFALDYDFELAGGQATFFTLATYTPTFRTRLLSGVPEVENVGRAGNINPGVALKWKGNAGVTYHRGRWSGGWTARYFDSYFAADPSVVTNANVLRNQGGDGRVSSQLYHDVFVRYEPQRTFDWKNLAGIEVQLGARNVFNRRPPFDASNANSYYSYFGDARLASYYVSLKRAF